MTGPIDQTIVALRVVDLRSEFEAQLRAVARLEEELRKAKNANGADGRALVDVIRRELTEMLTNNADIRNVLNELASDVPPSYAVTV
jgi:two-component sensor histidine kinase